VATFISQYYINQNDIPRELMLPLEIDDAAMVETWLTGKAGVGIKIIVPQRGQKVRLLELAERNAQLVLMDDLARRQAAFGKLPASVAALQRELGLPNPPRRIECFDISNLQGTDTVASMVLFIDGKPKKSEYRRYKIESVQGQNDYAAMREVVGRRIKRLAEERAQLPDLMLIDGGKGQLTAAADAFACFSGPRPPMAALAKRLEELFLPGHEDAIMIRKDSPALRLVQRIRDEAHRFAVSYHRTLRKKRVISSELDNIKGIGHKKKMLLLEKFGSVERIKNTPEKELFDVVGNTAAKKIIAHFSIHEK
jgi:excinuclease ABC subunit C